MEYSPAGFVFVAVGTPVATLVAVTTALATMAPEESVTIPRMAPVTVCAKAGQWGTRRTSAHANDLQISFIILSPLSGMSLPLPHQALSSKTGLPGKGRKPKTLQRSDDRLIRAERYERVFASTLYREYP
jgi:hypothetical protein